jgi:hypothetical protein
MVYLPFVLGNSLKSKVSGEGFRNPKDNKTASQAGPLDKTVVFSL